MTFYSTLSRYYEEIFPYSENYGAFFEALLKKEQSMLDAGCGTGSLVRHMRQKGYNARGFDLDKDMIKLAAGFLAEERPGDSELPEDVYRQGDMLMADAVFPEQNFHLISCIGNTMAHIPRKGLKQFLDAAFSMLLPGGSLLLQTINYRNIRQQELPLQDIRTPHCLFKRQYREDETREALLFETELTDLASHKTFKYSTKHYPLYQEELDEILKDRGFVNPEFFGSWSKDPVSTGQLPLIVKAERP